ncbi:hypothetical protein [Rubritalea sp.]|uniref:hypothetical protein n=1 Tax=Rubritalea sp. TaxID=2109375 RepID=UPI003EFB1BBE
MSKSNILIRMILSWLASMLLPLYIYLKANFDLMEHAEGGVTILSILIINSVREPIEKILKLSYKTNYTLIALFMLLPIVPVLVIFAVNYGYDLTWTIYAVIIGLPIAFILRDIYCIIGGKIASVEQDAAPNPLTVE